MNVDGGTRVRVLAPGSAHEVSALNDAEVCDSSSAKGEGGALSAETAAHDHDLELSDISGAVHAPVVPPILAGCKAQRLLVEFGDQEFEHGVPDLLDECVQVFQR